MEGSARPTCGGTKADLALATVPADPNRLSLWLKQDEGASQPTDIKECFVHSSSARKHWSHKRGHHATMLCLNHKNLRDIWAIHEYMDHEPPLSAHERSQSQGPPLIRTQAFLLG